MENGQYIRVRLRHLMTAQELYNKPNEEILEYFKKLAKNQIVNLGLSIKTIFDRRGKALSSFYLMKRTDMIILLSDCYLVYSRYDKNTYLRYIVIFESSSEFRVTMTRYKYNTGEFVDGKRIVQ